MYNVFNLLCVGLLCVVCYMKPLCCVCVELCHSNQIMYVYNYLYYFMYMFILNQRLMVLHISFFLFRGYSCSYHVIHMACIKVKSIMSRKNQKTLFYSLFDHLRVDRFTGFDTGLSVIPIGKPVIPTGIPIFCFSISKF
jgi:hypothetical protein